MTSSQYETGLLHGCEQRGKPLHLSLLEPKMHHVQTTGDNMRRVIEDLGAFLVGFSLAWVLFDSIARSVCR